MYTLSIILSLVTIPIFVYPAKTTFSNSPKISLNVVVISTTVLSGSAFKSLAVPPATSNLVELYNILSNKHY